MAPFDIASTRLSVFDALLRARRRIGGKTEILEDQDRKPLTYDGLIRAAFALGARVRTFTAPRERVGLMLPSAMGAAATFFALHAIGRRPVMLNFTAGARNLHVAIAAAGLKTILTSRRFIEQANLTALAEDIGAKARIVYLEDVRTEIGLKEKLFAGLAGLLPELFRAPLNPDDEAVLLFTSGSFGEPRGVVLSHANLVTNAVQCAAHIPFNPEWVFFSPLPVFHCFGLTGGMLLPLLTGHKAFLYPSPLHFKQIPKLVKETRASVLLATDTFAMQYARAADEADLSGLAFIVCGAERVREETRAAYHKRFGVMLLEGYGLTEASPVAAVNQPADNRPGTVGPLLPGLEARLEPVPGLEDGARLMLRGPNIMLGYLDPAAPGGIAPPEGGWHDTGDVVRIDAEGFVSILGRVKRFAKIGGEMVSLAAVESYAAALWPSHRHAAVALPCPRKGERVVLVSDRPRAAPDELLEWAQAHGAPELSVPKKIIEVPEVPVLGSGKTDYGAVVKIAESALEAA